ncbi:MAG: adenylate/guanylate cyclase domain-containing protein [Hyphomicrobiaceae bacterium]
MRPGPVYLLIVAVVLLGAVAVRIADPLPVARMRGVVFDTYQRLSPKSYDPATPVRIIAIDDESLARIGQWPWPRDILADLADRLTEKGAAAVGFDMVFSEPDRLSPQRIIERLGPMADDPLVQGILGRLPSNDGRFARAIAGASAVLAFVGVPFETGISAPPERGSFVLAGEDPAPFVPVYDAVISNLPLLNDPAAGIGSVNWLPEADQVVRRLPMLVRIGDTLYPSFAAEALRVAFQAPSYVVKSSGASGIWSFGQSTGIVEIRIASRIVPTDQNGQMWLRFSPDDRRRYIPAWKVLRGEVAEEEIAGRIMLVGATAAGLLDLRATALDRAVPGVMIHAAAIEQILEGTHLRRPDFILGAELFYLLVFGGLLGALVYRSGAAAGAALGALSLIGVGATSWLAFSRLGWLVDPVYPSLSITLLYIAGTVYLYLRTENERRRVRSAFSHYMAPAMVEELARRPDKLRLGGENRHMTLLFADVRGFTTLSEGLDAQSLTRFVNRLFSPLSNEILANRGTIDKYMGDAVMAFWNAPLDDPAHARNACRAALAMLKALERLNREWVAEALAAGRPPKPVSIGVGLNTGECCVGNLGSDQRFDYSVIGDIVNAASRIEGLTKGYRVPIIVGEATAKEADGLAFLELDRVNLRGKTERTRIFALLGDERLAASAAFARQRARHAELIDALAGKAPAATVRARIEACLATAVPGTRDLYEVFLERLHELEPDRPAGTPAADRDRQSEPESGT